MAMDGFDHLMDPYGGRLKEHQVPPSAWHVFKMCKSYLALIHISQQQSSLEKQHWPMSALGVEFDLLASIGVNAVATSEGDLDAIGITAGLVVVVQKTFLSLCAGELPTRYIIPLKIRDIPDATIVDVILDYNLFNDWGRASPGPENTGRTTLALQLSRHAEAFVYFHELCHLTYGHLFHKALALRGGPASIVEYDISSIPGDCRSYKPWSSMPMRVPQRYPLTSLLMAFKPNSN